jgi:nitrite reductase/ring-hydroxylating ferredoxin subunit
LEFGIWNLEFGIFYIMEWIKIFATESEARLKIQADQPQLLILNGKRIALVLHDKEFYAVQDSCTHNGESLSKGKINYLGDIICPWHGYRFELATGRACDSSCADLKTYPIRIDGDGFFVGIP